MTLYKELQIYIYIEISTMQQSINANPILLERHRLQFIS